MIWTIASLLDWTSGYFEKNGIESPHLEAEIILAHSLMLKRINLYTSHDRILKEDELAAYKALILRRIKKEPAAYIIGSRAFMSLDFFVDKSVLIPRPDTEKLVELAIDLAKSAEGKTEVLDIGTGSGAIAVSIAKYAKNAAVTATDSSPAALETAKKNAETHKVAGRLTFLEGDLFSPVPGGRKFDLIVSNPPYIPTEEIQKLQPEIKDHEPVQSLDGGTDGLDYYRRIIPQCPDFLIPGGHILLEVGMGQAQAVVKIIETNKELGNVKVHKDLAGIDRVVSAIKS